MDDIFRELVKIASVVIAESKEQAVKDRISFVLRDGKKRKLFTDDVLKNIDDLTNKIYGHSSLMPDKYGAMIAGWVKTSQLDIDDKERVEDIGRKLESYDAYSKKWKGKNKTKMPKEVIEAYSRSFEKPWQDMAKLDLKDFDDDLQAIDAYDNRGRTFDIFKPMEHVGKFEHNGMEHRVYRIENRDQLNINPQANDFFRNGGAKYCVFQKDSDYWSDYNGQPYYDIVRENDTGGLSHAGLCGLRGMFENPEKYAMNGENNGDLETEILKHLVPIIKQNDQQKLRSEIGMYREEHTYEDSKLQDLSPDVSSWYMMHQFGEEPGQDFKDILQNADSNQKHSFAKRIIDTYEDKPEVLRWLQDDHGFDFKNNIEDDDLETIFRNDSLKNSLKNDFDKLQDTFGIIGKDLKNFVLSQLPRSIILKTTNYEPEKLRQYGDYFGIDIGDLDNYDVNDIQLINSQKLVNGEFDKLEELQKITGLDIHNKDNYSTLTLTRLLINDYSKNKDKESINKKLNFANISMNDLDKERLEESFVDNDNLEKDDVEFFGITIDDLLKFAGKSSFNTGNIDRNLERYLSLMERGFIDGEQANHSLKNMTNQFNFNNALQHDISLIINDVYISNIHDKAFQHGVIKKQDYFNLINRRDSMTKDITPEVIDDKFSKAMKQDHYLKLAKMSKYGLLGDMSIKDKAESMSLDYNQKSIDAAFADLAAYEKWYNSDDQKKIQLMIDGFGCDPKKSGNEIIKTLNQQLKHLSPEFYEDKFYDNYQRVCNYAGMSVADAIRNNTYTFIANMLQDLDDRRNMLYTIKESGLSPIDDKEIYKNALSNMIYKTNRQNMLNQSIIEFVNITGIHNIEDYMDDEALKKYHNIDNKDDIKDSIKKLIIKQMEESLDNDDYNVTKDPDYVYVYDEHHQNKPQLPNMTRTESGWSNAEWLLNKHGKKKASVELDDELSELFQTEYPVDDRVKTAGWKGYIHDPKNKLTEDRAKQIFSEMLVKDPTLQQEGISVDYLHRTPNGWSIRKDEGLSVGEKQDITREILDIADRVVDKGIITKGRMKALGLSDSDYDWMLLATLPEFQKAGNRKELNDLVKQKLMELHNNLNDQTNSKYYTTKNDIQYQTKKLQNMKRDGYLFGAQLDAAERFLSSSDSEKEQMLEHERKTVNDQKKKVADQWKQYLSGGTYNDAFQYLTLNGMMTGYTYSKGINDGDNKHEILYVPHSATSVERMPFEPDPVVVGFVQQQMINGAFKDSYNAPMAYAKAIDEVAKNTGILAGVDLNELDGYETVPVTEGKVQGRWIHFKNEEESDDHERDVRLLSALANKTPWCTKSSAGSQLSDGQHWVFLDSNNQPRATFYLDKDDSIKEIRGILNGQGIEGDINPIVEQFNQRQQFPGGEKFIHEMKFKEQLRKLRDNAQKENRKVTKNELENVCEEYDYGLKDIKSSFDERKIEDGVYKGDIEITGYSVYSDVDYNYGEQNNLLDIMEIDVDLDSETAKNIHHINEQIKKLKKIDGNFTNIYIDDLGDIEEVTNELYLQGSKIRDLGKLKKVTKLDLYGTGVDNLGDLEEVTYALMLQGSKIKDLGKLKKVGTLDLGNTNVENLGNLEEISGELVLQDSKIKDLGKLKKVGTLDLGNTNIENLGNLEEVMTRLRLQNSKIKDLGNVKKIGALQLNNTEIESLGNLEEISGELVLQSSKVKDFGNLKRVGYLNLMNTDIENFGDLEEVTHELRLQKSKIKDLGKLKKIGRTNFFGTEIKSLGNLESASYLDLTFSKIQDLGKLKKVSTLQLGNADIESLGDLEEVTKELMLNSIVKDLGKLKMVGTLDLDGTIVESLGNLDEVHDRLSLQGSRIKDLGKLKRVNKLDLEKTQITSLGDLDVVHNLKVNNKIKDLGRLKKVGYLDLRGTNVESLGDLEASFGSLSLNDKIKDLGQLKRAQSLDLSSSRIESLGNLEKVSNLILSKTLKDFGNLNEMGSLMTPLNYTTIVMLPYQFRDYTGVYPFDSIDYKKILELARYRYKKGDIRIEPPDEGKTKYKIIDTTTGEVLQYVGLDDVNELRDTKTASSKSEFVPTSGVGDKPFEGYKNTQTGEWISKEDYQKMGRKNRVINELAGKYRARDFDDYEDRKNGVKRSVRDFVNPEEYDTWKQRVQPESKELTMDEQKKMIKKKLDELGISMNGAKYDSFNGWTFKMNVNKDRFAHFTTLDRAKKILQDGKLLMKPPYEKYGTDTVDAVSLSVGVYIPGVQVTHMTEHRKNEGGLVAVVFETDDVPSHGHPEEVKWKNDVHLKNATIMDIKPVKAKLKQNARQMPEEYAMEYGV